MTRLTLALICAAALTACTVLDYQQRTSLSSIGPTTMDEPLPDGCKRVHDGAQLWRVCQ